MCHGRGVSKIVRVGLGDPGRLDRGVYLRSVTAPRVGKSTGLGSDPRRVLQEGLYREVSLVDYSDDVSLCTARRTTVPGCLMSAVPSANLRNPNASVSQPLNRSRDVMRLPLEPDVVSSDSTNSMREQLRQVNQRIDKVQRDFVRSKEEVGETTKGRSPKRLRQVQLVTIGFTGDSVSPAGTTALPVTVGEEPR
ncbi:hypothetical protein GW17_00055193 [Ensete ventricosum]|nr:hypothetical protein GW17_00055193 [Ensete ventricosum]